jgi:hypothetical protein
MSHLDRLRDAMEPDPSEWRYTGIVRDTGSPIGSTCSCGQAIRYEFVIERPRDSSSLIIGSRCIETSIPYLMGAGARTLARELESAYARHRRELTEARKRERDEQARIRLTVARSDLQALTEWFDAARRECSREAAERGQRILFFPADIDRRPRPPKESGTPARTLASLRRGFVSRWLRALRYAHEHAATLPPLPDEESLRARLGEDVRGRTRDELDPFNRACRFARLAYHGSDAARDAVPLPDDRHQRGA